MAVITVTDVPIFDEHGSFSRTDLEEIAANSQARIDDTGDSCPLTLGHTPKKGEQLPDPPIVGSARNFRVGQFGKTNPRACIFADFDIEAKHADLVREQYPRRSIELWPQDRVIDPIALLGSRTPQRDLGLLKFNRHADESVHYSRERDGEPERHEMGNEGMFTMQDFLSTFLETPIGRVMQEIVDERLQQKASNVATADQVNQNAEDALGGDEEQLPGEELPPEEAMNPDELPGDMDDEPADEAPGDESPFDEEPDMADEKKKKPPVKMERGADAIRMERDQLAIKFARLEKEFAELKAESATNKAKRWKSEREAKLVQLEAEGVQFERATEMEDTESMSPEKFEKHLTKMRKCYNRAPINHRIFTGEIADGGGAPKRRGVESKEDLDKVHRYMRDKKYGPDQYDRAIEECFATAS